VADFHIADFTKFIDSADIFILPFHFISYYSAYVDINIVCYEFTVAVVVVDMGTISHSFVVH